MKREARRIEKPLSNEDRVRYDQLRIQLEGEKSEIIARGRRLKAASENAAIELRHAVEQLKTARLAQGLSIEEIEARSGVGEGTLARLENDVTSHPTLAAVTCYAEVLGKRVTVLLRDAALAH